MALMVFFGRFSTAAQGCLRASLLDLSDLIVKHLVVLPGCHLAASVCMPMGPWSNGLPVVVKPF
jgi:hypothetical protein